MKTLGLFGGDSGERGIRLRPKTPPEPEGIRLRPKRYKNTAELFTEMGYVQVEPGSPVWVNPRVPHPWVWVPGRGWSEIRLREKDQ